MYMQKINTWTATWWQNLFYHDAFVSLLLMGKYFVMFQRKIKLNIELNLYYKDRFYQFDVNDIVVTIAYVSYVLFEPSW